MEGTPLPSLVGWRDDYAWRAEDQDGEVVSSHCNEQQPMMERSPINPLETRGRQYDSQRHWASCVG